MVTLTDITLHTYREEIENETNFLDERVSSRIPMLCIKDKTIEIKKRRTTKDRPEGIVE